MLSIGAMGSHSMGYYTGLAREDYYFAGGEPPGMWFGTGAERVGLYGTVEKEPFQNLFRGYSPDGAKKWALFAGKVKTETEKGHHPGWDLTFSAPKSVSVLWSQADRDTREAIQRAQLVAVKHALSQLEERAAITKRGSGGSGRETTEGFIVAAFEHGTSRNQDPQLHTHCLVMNLSPRKDGTVGTIMGQPLFQAKMEAGAIYRERLEHELQKHLFLATFPHKQSFEIAGIPIELVDRFSTRRKEVLEELSVLKDKSAESAALVTLLTREKKAQLPREELFRRWQEIGREYGFSAEAVLRRERSELTDSVVSQAQREIQKAAQSVQKLSTKQGRGEEGRTQTLPAKRKALVSDKILRETVEEFRRELKYLSHENIAKLRALARGDRVSDWNHTNTKEQANILQAAKRAHEKAEKKLIIITGHEVTARNLRFDYQLDAWTAGRFLKAREPRTHLETLKEMRKAGVERGVQFHSVQSFLKYAEQVKRSKLKLDKDTTLVILNPQGISKAQLSQIVRQAKREGAQVRVMESAHGQEAQNVRSPVLERQQEQAHERGR
jgi:conjugative relaxase-like TrwC/TraI family protein